MKKKPNVVFVLTDDQGYGDLSCTGNPVVKTPYIDRLHSESIRFTDFHAAPVCTPTRSEIMTGRDAFDNCATFVCLGRTLLRTDLPTMADIFRDNGYKTGQFGKWHLGENYPYRPIDRGFDESVYHPGSAVTSAPDYFFNDYFDDHYRHKDKIEQYKGYCTDVWFDLALDWIDECRKKDEPFLAYIATNAPHAPLWVQDEYRQPYLDTVDYKEASFFGMISNIDENLKELDDYLEKNGLKDNTILIYMTDNGTEGGETIYNAGMKGKKRSLYEGGHRVPFFIRWPDGKLEGGRDIKGVARTTDILPTLIDLCGLEAGEETEFDGFSLTGSIEKGFTPDDRMAVIQYGHPYKGFWGYTEKYHSAVLWKTWRLVDGKELYDISSDPGQEKDIAEANPGIVEKMLRHYEEWWEKNGSNLDFHQPITIGSDKENPTRLCSADWAEVYADWPQHIRGCVMDSGVWHVNADRAGEYEFTLMRWPEESKLGISAPAPVLKGVDGELPAGVALPVSKAWLKINDREETLQVPEGASGITFKMNLDKGPARIKSWWYDEKGKTLAGAFYMNVERKSK
jgi:arylsulfatase A-like enzyme